MWGERTVKYKLDVLYCLFMLLFGFLTCSLTDERFTERR